MSQRFWAWPVSVALAALLLSTACSQKQEPPPKLSFDKEQVSLGTVPRDHWGMVTFLAVNKGEGLLNVGPFVISAQEGTALATVPQGTLSVKPGDSGVIRIEFTGHQATGPHRLSVRVPSNDPLRLLSTLTIQFTVSDQPTPAPERPGPRLRVDKELVDGGSVVSDHPLYERFLLRNDGDAPLVLQGVPLVKVLDGC